VAAAGTLDVLSAKLWNCWEKFGRVEGMRLYVLRERWGRLTRSIRRPDLPKTPEQDLDKALEEARYPGYLPWEDLDLKLPSDFVWQMGKFLTLYGFRTLGLRGAQLHMWIRGVVISVNRRYVIGLAIAKVGAYVVPPLIMLMIAYVGNPELVEFVAEEVSPQQYLLTYEDRVWYGDIIEIDSEQRGVYKLCRQCHLMKLIEYRNSFYKGMSVDMWELGHTWVEIKSRILKYQEWRWNLAWLEFIGVCYMQQHGIYRLQGSYTDPWVADVQAPWRKDPDDFCDWSRDWEIPPI